MKRTLYIAACFAASAFVLSWFLAAESSPVYEWLVKHPTAGNVVAIVNLPAFVVAVLGSGNVHAPSTAWLAIGMTAQWFVIGLIAGWAWSRLRRDKASTTRL